MQILSTEGRRLEARLNQLTKGSSAPDPDLTQALEILRVQDLSHAGFNLTTFEGVGKGNDSLFGSFKLESDRCLLYFS